MSKYIDRNKIKYRVIKIPVQFGCQQEWDDSLVAYKEDIEAIPAADVVEVRHGRWEQKRVFDSKVVDQWQSAYCPVCHRYHTTPYLYYFTHYEYCPNCGARMDGGADDAAD